MGQTCLLSQKFWPTNSTRVKGLTIDFRIMSKLQLWSHLVVKSTEIKVCKLMGHTLFIQIKTWNHLKESYLFYRKRNRNSSICNTEKVECQFYGDIGATIIKHYHSVDSTITSEIGTLDGCSEPGCFIDNITYAASSEQIEAIIFLAKECSQEVNFKCSYNRLTGYSWWIGRDGSENIYWHGNSSQENGCACFNDDSCGRYKIH